MFHKTSPATCTQHYSSRSTKHDKNGFCPEARFLLLLELIRAPTLEFANYLKRVMNVVCSFLEFYTYGYPLVTVSHSNYSQNQRLLKLP